MKYNEKDYYMHANTTDFTREVVKEIILDEVEQQKTSGDLNKPKEKDVQSTSPALTKYEKYLEACRKETEETTSGSESDESF